MRHSGLKDWFMVDKMKESEMLICMETGHMEKEYSY